MIRKFQLPFLLLMCSVLLLQGVSKAQIVVSDSPYNAKCDGRTDDTAAFQKASDDAFASINPSELRVPATGHSCVISEWNLTNHFGAQFGKNGSVTITGLSGSAGQQSTLECQEAKPNTGNCIDLSGSDHVTINNLFVTSGVNPPRTMLLLGRTTEDLGFSHGFNFTNLTLHTTGQFSFYTFGGEVVQCVACNFAYIGNSRTGDYGEAAIMLSSSNTRQFSSSFATLCSATHRCKGATGGWVSQSQVGFDAASIISCSHLTGGANACIELDNVLGLIQNVTFDGYYNIGSDKGRRFIADLGASGELHNVTLGPSKFRVEGTNAGNQLAVFQSASIKGFVVTGTFAGGVSLENPEIVFANARGSVGEGSIINLQPGDDQNEYPGGHNPTAMVSCARGMHVLGLVIYDRSAYGGGNTPNNCPGDIEFPGTNRGWSMDGAGNLTIPGTLTAANKNFKIDHPLDPANKYLVHTSIESSEMMNIYSGNVTTDSQGEATVQLPEWFEALNTDFRYQLTVVGQFAQAIVARKIANHQFAIKTNARDVEVSWQVAGVRQDAYAKAHPLVVEEEKAVAAKELSAHP